MSKTYSELIAEEKKIRFRPKLVGKADTKFGHLVNIKNLFMAGAYKRLQREIKMLKEV
jgi:hypothetical protein